MASGSTPAASVQGGATPYKLISANTTNATVVKASQGQVYNVIATNVNAAVCYLKLYDKATTPAETDTPKLVLAIPAASQVNVQFPVGVLFTSGISFRTVTGIADNDTNAVAASEHAINLTYK